MTNGAPPSESIGPRRGVDYAQLEGYLKGLAYANRLELLELLQQPRTLDEIHLQPSIAQAGINPDRPITRQAVQNHLDRLIEMGLVQVGTTERKGKRPMNEYRVDHSRLFAVVEDLRKLATIESGAPLDPYTTIEAPHGKSPAWIEGPKLVLVHGVNEGKAFPLRLADAKSPRGWVIGRGKECQVRLAYDPFVSTENAEVLRTEQGFRLLDLRTSRNGTFLNWRRLPVGAEVPLGCGDVIGVGRSLLVFRDK